MVEKHGYSVYHMQKEIEELRDDISTYKAIGLVACEGLEKEVKHWKANHDDCVRKKRIKDKIILELRQILKDWKETQGNHRDAKWWHDWTDRVNAALGEEDG